ncbi:gal galnac lectin subunit igl2 [Entamoeba histolytica]|uniref:Gal/GalNAc lectin subunit Igl2 n=2 Tax=Entamoeba histolytica TaxID=5759 RepID=C4M6L0_ENTH1|nr:Gal/GalNAc lectin subunit Igl2 [Entamoeba histolytica HM-1:IMSS]EAL47008.1 Gal/GalNAc lectin subunit Igl2 [Entamoeba histolytica HM-1:IMSS]GAT97129.1 gal galnac lectin subunit igl2 [Entamoeba histolytica]|eukprot:XP_652394.1 Gal/GalNAc lectin subunit Igl2 [Entamoeba histolytica HM-1:IMSS]
MFILLLFISISLGDYTADKLINNQEPRTAVPHCASVSNGACASCDEGYELKTESGSGSTQKCTLKEETCKSAFSYYDGSDSNSPKCVYCENGKESDTSSSNNEKCKCKNGVDTCESCLSKDNDKCGECVIGMSTTTNGGQKLCDTVTTDEHAENCVGLTAKDSSSKQCDKCFGMYSLQSGQCTKKNEKIEKCILQVESSCNQCADGYYINTEKKCTKYPDHCSKMNSDKCNGCMEGYYLNGTECKVCTIDNSKDLSEGNECSIYNAEHCESCNKRCTVSDGVCVKNHCRLFSPTEENKCTKCDDGYFLTGAGKCSPNLNDGFKTSAKTECQKGYYLEKDGDKKRCSLCPDPFTECLTSQTPVPGKLNLRSAHLTSTDGPCKLPGCLLCSDDDTICYKCENGLTLNGTHCYNFDVKKVLGTSGNNHQVCKMRGYDQYEQYLNAFKASDNTYYCPLKDLYLPYYFSVTKGSDNKITIGCVGKDRDVKNDCECNDKYIPKSVDKASDCVSIKTKLPSCERAANENICTQCPVGSHVDSNGKCSCGDAHYFDQNNKCQECPASCSSCSYDSSKSKVVCSECYENIQGVSTRDKDNECACKKDTPEYKEGLNAEDKKKSCAQLNNNCKEEGHYKISDGFITCLECDDSAYIVDSQTKECAQCASNAFKDENNKCQLCSTKKDKYGHCSACSATACIICEDTNLVLAASGSNAQCTVCKDGFYQIESPTDGVYCSPCPAKCKTCKYSADKKEIECVTCTDQSSVDIKPPTCACLTGTVQLENGTCQSCSDLSKYPGCKTTDTCNVDSRTGYIYATECSDGFSGRSPYSNCTTCIESNYYPKEGEKNGCAKCDDKCATCSDKDTCLTCTDPLKIGSKCDECKTGYYMSNGECKPCTNHCSECSSAAECTVCESDTYKVISGNGCNACVDGFYFDEIKGTCIPCTSPCTKCVGVKKDCEEQETGCNSEKKKIVEECTKCSTKDHIAEVPVNGACVCAYGYVEGTSTEDNKIECQSCKAKVNEFCDSCNSKDCLRCNAEYLEAKGGECVCVEGYYTSSWGSCIPCSRHMPHCTKCTGEGECTTCEDGWKLKDGKCNGAKGIFIMMMIVMLAFMF